MQETGINYLKTSKRRNCSMENVSKFTNAALDLCNFKTMTVSSLLFVHPIETLSIRYFILFKNELE